MKFKIRRLCFNLALRGRLSFGAFMRRLNYLGETFLSRLSGEASMCQAFVRSAFSLGETLYVTSRQELYQQAFSL
jgi:hypothetical protein